MKTGSPLKNQFRPPPRPMHGTTVILILLACAATLPATAFAQCGGTPDCSLQPVPFFYGTASTEMNPGGNFFLVGGPPGGVCIPVGGTIAGSAQIRIPLTETIFFTTGGPQGLAIEVLAPGTPTPGGVFPLNGTQLRAGGVMCFTSFAEAMAVTNVEIATLFGGILTQYAFPVGVAPLSAAGIATASPGFRTFTLCVQTSDNNIHVVFNNNRTVYTIPQPIVVTPESFTNGRISGVLLFSANTYHVLSGGVLSTLPLTGTYISHVYTPNGVTVTTSAGAQPIALASGVTMMVFMPCVLPLVSCPAPSGSGIAMNVAPAIGVKAVSSTWPVPAVNCALPGGLGFMGKSLRRPKFGSASAIAEAHPGTGQVDTITKQLIFRDPNIFEAATMKAILGPLSTKPLPPMGKPKAGEWARAAIKAWDPFHYEDWDDTEDFPFSISLGAGEILAVYPDYYQDSFSRMTMEVTSSLPDLGSVLTLVLTATHDGVDPQLDIDFTSDPALGLNPADIENAIFSNLAYDPATGYFSMFDDVILADVMVDIPAGVSEFEFRSNFGEHASLGNLGGIGPEEFWLNDGVYNPELGEECDHPNRATCSEEGMLVGDWDCTGNSVPDFLDIENFDEWDCNMNFIPDSCDIAGGESDDLNLDGVPDECEIDETTGIVDPLPILPNRILRGATPNPFNAATDIIIETPGDTRIRVDIYNAKGALITTLADKVFDAGRHAVHWQGTDANGNVLGSGVYFVKLQSGKLSEVTKVALIK